MFILAIYKNSGLIVLLFMTMQMLMLKVFNTIPLKFEGNARMEPLGTITMYYPFVDDGTKTIMNEMMKRAFNYADFARMLADYVSNEDVSDPLPMIAMKHAQNLCDIESLNKISKRYGQNFLVKPFFYLCYSCTHGIPQLDKAVTSSQEALERDLENWIQFEILDMKIRASLNQSSGGPEVENDLDAMRRLVSNNEDLDCYANIVHGLTAAQLWNEGHKQEALVEYEVAVESARRVDDRVNLAKLHRNIASLLRVSNPTKSRDLLMIAKDMFEELGLGLWDTLTTLGRIHELRGEFNAALEHYHESHISLEKRGSPTFSTSLRIAAIYLMIEDGEAALEWANMALVAGSHSDPSKSSALHILARAQILLGEYEEASDNLDFMMNVALKSGFEHILASSYLVQGLLEKSQGDLKDADLSITRALETYERHSDQTGINDCLLRLAEIEVESFSANDENRHVGSREKALPLLIDVARTKDYPGILGLALLLKAELLIKQGRTEDAGELLREVHELAEHPETSFLTDKIDKLRVIVDNAE